MTLAQAIALAIVALMMALFIWGRLRHDVVALLALLASIATGIVPSKEAFQGFSDDIVITIEGAAPKTPLDRTNWLDDTPANSNWIYVLGGGKLKTYPVTGTVLVDGKPADGAMVIFCPINPGPEIEQLRPSGKTDATGAFALMTFESGDGAPAADYKVLVKWPAPAQVDARDGRGGRPGPDRLRGKY